MKVGVGMTRGGSGMVGRRVGLVRVKNYSGMWNGSVQGGGQSGSGTQVGPPKPPGHLPPCLSGWSQLAGAADGGLCTGQGGLGHALTCGGPSRLLQSRPPSEARKSVFLSFLYITVIFAWSPHSGRGTGIEVRIELSPLQMATHLWV